jgi:hypothetical protein
MRLALVLIFTACSSRVASSTSAANYELDCAPANTATAAQLNCVRTDTRTGDILVIDYMKLPVSNDLTATGTAPAGRFATSCNSTSTEKRADFYCIRMNTETGELLLINLQKISVFPPRHNR